MYIHYLGDKYEIVDTAVRKIESLINLHVDIVQPAVPWLTVPSLPPNNTGTVQNVPKYDR